MKDSNNYVRGHDFGYGKSEDKIKINKILLRDLDDLKVYLKDLCLANFFFKDGLIYNKEDGSLVYIKLEELGNDKF